MNEIRINRHDLNTRLHDCHAMAVFLADAFNLILEENGTYNTEIYPVPHGASSCILTLADKIKAISQEI